MQRMQTTHPFRVPQLAALACVLMTGCASNAQRDESPISTDRPGFLFAPTLVPTGRTQAEAGVPFMTLSRDSGDELRAWSFPVALRYGLTETVELRASLPTWTDARDESGGSVSHYEGFGDVEVGAKFALPPIDSAPVAALVSLRLPTGAADFTTDELGGSAYLLAGRDLNGGYWLQGMLGLTHTPVEGADDTTTGALGALVSHSIANRAGAYVELAILPGLDHANGQAFAGFGFTWTPLDQLQFDASADFGLDDDSADALLGLGISWHF